MGRFLAIAIALATIGACKDKSKTGGLPPAPDWSANAGQLAPAQPGAAARNNPHGGAGMPGNNPHAGVPGAPPLDRCVRVTVGTAEERAAFAEILRDVLATLPENA